MALVLSLAATACAGPLPEPPGPAVPGAIDTEITVFLVGDAGEPDPRFEPVLAALSADIAANGARTLVAFLGDNIYPAGLPPGDDPGRGEANRRIAAQVRAVADAGGEAVFIPGNHDWNYAGAGGLERVRAQERLVEALGAGRVRFLPDGGCPGPAILDAGERLRLVALDTEWWLQDPSARGDGAACPAPTEAGVVASIEDALAGAAGRHVVVLGHHPLRSGGNHGGHFTWRQHLFPLRDLAGWAWVPVPILGSAYPIVRARGISDQDVGGDRNGRMRAALESAFRAAPPLLYAAGHEHNLQVLQGTSADWEVISGGGIHGHTTPVTSIADTRFAAARSGYVRLDIQRDGRVRLGVITVDERGTGREVMALDLGHAR